MYLYKTDSDDSTSMLYLGIRDGELVIEASNKCNYQSVCFEIPINNDNKGTILSQLERLRSEIQDYEPNRYEAWVYKGNNNDN